MMLKSRKQIKKLYLFFAFLIISALVNGPCFSEENIKAGEPLFLDNFDKFTKWIITGGRPEDYKIIEIKDESGNPTRALEVQAPNVVIVDDIARITADLDKPAKNVRINLDMQFHNRQMCKERKWAYFAFSMKPYTVHFYSHTQGTLELAFEKGGKWKYISKSLRGIAGWEDLQENCWYHLEIQKFNENIRILINNKLIIDEPNTGLGADVSKIINISLYNTCCYIDKIKVNELVGGGE